MATREIGYIIKPAFQADKNPWIHGWPCKKPPKKTKKIILSRKIVITPFVTPRRGYLNFKVIDEILPEFKAKDVTEAWCQREEIVYSYDLHGGDERLYVQGALPMFDALCFDEVTGKSALAMADWMLMNCCSFIIKKFFPEHWKYIKDIVEPEEDNKANEED